mgnify:CR=1 FL=1
MEGGQSRHQYQAGQRCGHIHAQSPARDFGGGRQTGFGIVQVRQQARGALIVGGAVRGHVDLASGAMEQLHPQVRFQLLH